MRLVDAEALKEKVRYSMHIKMGFINYWAEIPEENRKRVIDSIDLHRAFIKLIDEQPTIEAQSERTGKWLLNGGRPCECSVCHREGNEYGDARFCAYCGAKMKGDAE